MFSRTPPLIAPIVTTAGSRVRSSWRLTIVCRPRMTCADGDDRVDPQPRRRAVRLAAVDGDLQLVGARHRRPRPVADRRRPAAATVTCRPKIACGVGFSSAPSAIIIFAPPSSPSGGISSAGWKMNLTLPRSCVAHARRAPRPRPSGSRCGSRGRRRASRRRSRRSTVAVAFDCERQVDCFGDRQRVHVGAQRDHRAGQAALQQPRRRRCARRRCALSSRPSDAQVVGDDGRGAELAVAEFGMLVQVAPPGDDAALDRGRRRRRSSTPGCWR